jgi:ribosomal protein L21E
MSDEVDANGTEVSLDDWGAVVANLREFADECRETDERVVCEFGQGARFAVAADGSVEAGMPLHDFADGGARMLVIDHDGGSITVVGDGTEYTFRRP